MAGDRPYNVAMRALSVVFVAVWLVLQPETRAQTALPSPESVLGYRVGADYKVATYDETVAYFQKLDAASGGQNYIETVWGRGYVLREPEDIRESA